MAMFEIIQGHPGEADYTWYGATREFVRYRGHESILHGPAETGKTLGALSCIYAPSSIKMLLLSFVEKH